MSGYQHRLAAGAVLVVLAAGLISTAASRAMHAQEQSGELAAAQSDPAASLTAGEKFKNLQILKDIPADQLFPAMKFVASSLGVTCSYCHVRPFEKDDKKTKLKARQMMVMVLQLNKTSFDGERKVTCYTCHRGAARPVTIPMVSAQHAAHPTGGPSGESEAPVQESLPTAEQIVARYTRAIGGAEAIAKLRTRRAVGVLEGDGFRGEIEEISLAPNKAVSIFRNADGNSTQGFDGSTAWQQGPKGEVRDGERRQLQKFSDFFRALDLTRTYREMRVAGKEQLAGRVVYALTAEPVIGGGVDRLYIDAESGLLVRVVSHNETPLGINPEETEYSDYRDAGGIKVPFVQRFAEPGSGNTLHYTAIQFNTSVEESKFKRPADTAPGSSAKP